MYGVQFFSFENEPIQCAGQQIQRQIRPVRGNISLAFWKISLYNESQYRTNEENF